MHRRIVFLTRGRPTRHSRRMEDIMTRSTISVGALAVVTALVSLAAQSLPDVRRQYDAGQYQQVVAAGQSTPAGPKTYGAGQDQQGVAAGQASQDPRVVYLGGQAAQKLSRQDEARKAYEQLAARPASDPWHGVGRSAIALLGSDAGG